MDRRDVLRLAALAVPGLALGGAAAAAGRVVTSRIRIVGSRVVMAVTIGGRGPYDFMIDTGGFLSLIDDATARELDLPIASQVRGTGVGGRITLPVYLARDVVFGGGARQPTVALAGRDGRFGPGVVGALAAGMVTAVDCDLDFAAGEWRLYPDGRPEREGFVRMRDALVAGGSGPGAGSRRLFGDASVDGRAGRFLLDTGAPGGFVLDHDVARKTGLWDDAKPYAPVRPSGIGGAAGIARIVRADAATFGGVTFPRPLVMLRGSGEGAGGSEQGVVGLNVLRLFTLSTDTAARALWVKADPGAVAPPERHGLSGLWLDRRGGDWVVAAVGTGSPAAAAGIAAGDTVALPGGGVPIPALARGPGTRVDLIVGRGGGTRPVTLTLAAFL